MSVLNGVLEKGRCRTAWSCYLAVQHTICNAIKVLLGQQTEAIILSVGEFPSGTWQAGSVSWIQRMMEQVIESSVTKPGPALGAPRKTPHNHLRQLLPRNLSLFLNSCVCSLMPTKYRWLKALCLMLKEGRKAMALDLRVLVPAFFSVSTKAIEELDCTMSSYMWQCSWQYTSLLLWGLPEQLSYLCALRSLCQLNINPHLFQYDYFLLLEIGTTHH